VKRLFKLILFSLTFTVFFFVAETAAANEPKSKFYDFSEQLIDGERKKPTTLYLNAREQVKFGRLLKLKKSFLPKLFETAKERVFK
jgi:hypothetical protein